MHPYEELILISARPAPIVGVLFFYLWTSTSPK